MMATVEQLASRSLTYKSQLQDLTNFSIQESLLRHPNNCSGGHVCLASVVLLLERALPLAALATARALPMAPTDQGSRSSNTSAEQHRDRPSTASHRLRAQRGGQRKRRVLHGKLVSPPSRSTAARRSVRRSVQTFPNPRAWMLLRPGRAVHQEHRRVVWLLQYTQDTSGKNIHRIAYHEDRQGQDGRLEVLRRHAGEPGLRRRHLARLPRPRARDGPALPDDERVRRRDLEGIGSRADRPDELQYRDALGLTVPLDHSPEPAR